VTNAGEGLSSNVVTQTPSARGNIFITPIIEI
jgi:hypothetical protein